MRYSLEKFSSIPEADRQNLASDWLRIKDTDQLLEYACTPTRIRQLAKAARIPYESLVQHASLADLVRVKGLSPSLAETLVASGAAATVQQLAQTDPARLQEKLKVYRSESVPHVHVPALEVLKQVCSEAGEMRPRLSLQEEDKDPLFRRELFAKARKSLKSQIFLQLGILGGMFVLPVLLMVAAVYLYLVPRIPKYITAYEQINRILQSAQRLNYDLVVYSTLVLLIIFLGVVLVMFVIYYSINFIEETWLVLLLFPSHALQNFYQQVNATDEKKQNRNLWRVVAIFAAILASLTLVGLYMSIVKGSSIEIVLKTMAWLAIPGGSLAAVLAFLPDLRFTFQQAKRNSYPEDYVKRLFVHRIFILMLLPMMVILLVKIFLPFSLSWHERIYQEKLFPAVTAQFFQKGQQLRAITSTDAMMERDRKAGIALVEQVMPATMLSVASSSLPTGMDIEGGISAGLNMVVWLAITTFLLYFVVPYLILGGWKRGIFYMLIIALSYWIGELFVENAPAWFGLPEKSTSRFLVAAFFVFITTLFFDWIFGLVVNKRKRCPACHLEQPQESLYCSHCGFRQE